MLTAGAVAAGIVVAVVLALGNHQRSFVVQAQTHGLSIRFQGAMAKAWPLDHAWLCIRHASEPDKPTAGAHPTCDPRIYDWVDISRSSVLWPDGTSIEVVHADPALGLELEISPREPLQGLWIGGFAVTQGSRLIIPEEDWNRSPRLPFSGLPVFGGEPGSSVVNHVVTGRFEVREPNFLRTNPVKMQEGDFFTGDRARLIDRQSADPSLVTGFLTAAHGDERGNGFEVIAYSGPNDAVLEIERTDAVAARISPSWTDRALNDPAVLGLAGLLGLIAAVVELTGGFYALLLWVRK